MHLVEACSMDLTGPVYHVRHLQTCLSAFRLPMMGPYLFMVGVPCHCAAWECTKPYGMSTMGILPLLSKQQG